MSIEHWKQIGETYYYVSDFGRVASARVGFRIMRPRTRADGKIDIKLFVNEIPRKFTVSRLVANAFIGPAPGDGYFVIHLDGDKGNNAAKNLKWSTPVETQYRNTHILHRQQGVRGDRHWNAKLNAATVLRVRERIAAGEMGKTIAADMGISYKDVSRIKTRKRWGHVQ